MAAPDQQIHFARSSDGTRIAYATTGASYPLLMAAHWLGHLEFDWQTSVFQPWIEQLGAGYRLIRHDSRGCGLSDRDVENTTLDAMVDDLAAVVDTAGLARFALLGKSQGAPSASPMRRGTPTGSATWSCAAPSRAASCGAIRPPNGAKPSRR